MVIYNLFGYYNKKEIYSRSITEKNEALLIFNNQFCPIWKSEKVSFIRAVEEPKSTFKTVNNYISAEKVSNYYKYEYIL